jgi:glycine cleavage system regulatory protein
LTVIGEDRPGLVERLSQLVASHGGNWEESRMARLEGRFAGILRVCVDPDRALALEAALGDLEPAGLKVTVERAGDRTGLEGYRRLRLEVVGNDRAGIVHEIARTLARRGINVDELHTECDSAPMSGGMLFKATAALRSPPALSLDELRADLEGLANDLMVDVSLDDAGDR